MNITHVLVQSPLAALPATQCHQIDVAQALGGVLVYESKTHFSNPQLTRNSCPFSHALDQLCFRVLYLSVSVSVRVDTLYRLASRVVIKAQFRPFFTNERTENSPNPHRYTRPHRHHIHTEKREHKTLTNTLGLKPVPRTILSC